MMENGRGLGKKINGGQVTVSQVKDGGKELKQKLLQIESATKIFNNKITSPKVALSI
jgi:hypothetical protein